jgi:hypothetical protein
MNMTMNEIAMMTGYVVLAAWAAGLIAAVPFGGWALWCYVAGRRQMQKSAP